MNTSTTPNTAAIGTASVGPTTRSENTESRDRTLAELRSGRRLNKIVSSIESFLNNQVSRLEEALAKCERTVDNDKIVRKMLADFEREKRIWQEEREAETRRLSQAGEELIKAWDQLEEERRNWLDSREASS